MIQLSSFMWAMGIFFAIIGFIRGWNRELIATAGIFVSAFFLFQFDSLIRGTLFANISRDQSFLVQAGIFLALVFISYRTRSISIPRASARDDWQNHLLGGIVGFINGYLITGTLWYFLDINEYPLSPFITAPSPGSPSDQARDLLPLVVLGGGVGGNGDFLTIAVIVLFLIIMFII